LNDVTKVMSQAGVKPTIPALKQSKTVHTTYKPHGHKDQHNSELL